MKTQHRKKHLRALISVYNKDAVRELVELLHGFGVEMISTGGTFRFIRDLGLPVTAVEELTGYPSILGGRVKTLHPAIMGAILCRPDLKEDLADIKQYGLEPIDMVVTDLYPFEETVLSEAGHDEIIEKIDIGGISLIRAAAKNFAHVYVVPGVDYFADACHTLLGNEGCTTPADRKKMAAAAMDISSHYDTLVFRYLNDDPQTVFKESIRKAEVLRYGENPHQKGYFYGNMGEVFDQLNGKPLSYNNLLDIDAAFSLISEFTDPTFVIVKHTNACGVSSRETIEDAWQAAFAGDPVSAFGGILMANRPIDSGVADSLHDLFFEVLIAPDYHPEAIQKLVQKEKRIILQSKQYAEPSVIYRSVLNGVLVQSPDDAVSKPEQWQAVTKHAATADQLDDLLFANIIVKHLKSNAIALVKNKMLIGTGIGQSSRVDAVKQAIMKAGAFHHDTEDAVLASDAFFPFPDCVEMAAKHGISAIVQPGGSVRDKDSVNHCNQAGVAMYFSGIRHFKH